jgi:hypothetical protein
MVQPLERGRIRRLCRCSSSLGGIADPDLERGEHEAALRRAIASPAPTARARANALRRSAAIEDQEATEAGSPFDVPISALPHQDGLDEPVPNPLVRPLAVVVLGVLRERAAASLRRRRSSGEGARVGRATAPPQHGPRRRPAAQAQSAGRAGSRAPAPKSSSRARPRVPWAGATFPGVPLGRRSLPLLYICQLTRGRGSFPTRAPQRRTRASCPLSVRVPLGTPKGGL